MSVELNPSEQVVSRDVDPTVLQRGRGVQVDARVPNLVPGFDAPFFQAGLAGYSDAAMRIIARRQGCPYCVTEALLDRTLLAGGRGFAKADLGRHTFKRYAVIGSAIVDFNCHSLGMAISIDEEEPDVIATRRDKSLEAVGVRVMRIKAADILENIDDVLARITAGMRMRIADKKDAARAHREANPNQHYSRPNRAPHRKTHAQDR